MSSRTQALSITQAQVFAFRVKRHNLDGRARGAALAPVAGVAAIHAQLMSSAELQFWARLSGASQGDMEKELWKQKSLVKLWAMRSTLHIVPAADLDVFTLGLTPIDQVRRVKRLASVGLSPTDVDAVTEAVAEALDKRALTRRELNEEVRKRSKTRLLVESSFGGDVFTAACRAGILCLGPDGGEGATFVRADQWVRRGRKRWPVERAQAELLRRYLRAYGPSTRQEYARWAGIDLMDAKTTWESLSGELAEVAVEGRRAWILSEDVNDLENASLEHPVRLIPMFDVYLAGRDRDRLTRDKGEHKRIYREAGWVSAVVLARGPAIGVWTHKVAKGRMAVRLESFRSYSKTEKIAVSDEAERLAGFLGSSLDLSYESG